MPTEIPCYGMSHGQQTPDKKKPHWAWPHVIAVAIAIVAYYLIFRYTGDADLLDRHWRRGRDGRVSHGSPPGTISFARQIAEAFA